MTFEFINIVQQFKLLKAAGHSAVLATVVHVNGSSYRRPGVQMLLSSTGEMFGAVSGGCVEKEVQRQAQSVLDDGISKIMTYDGRFRLGCEGMLFILLETFNPAEEEFLAAFDNTLEKRNAISIRSQYKKEEALSDQAMFTACSFDSAQYFPVNQAVDLGKISSAGYLTFNNQLDPRFRLVIVGSEHDSFELCQMAAQMGWEVIVVASARDPKTIADFSGAKTLINTEVEHFDLSVIDNNSAVVLMTHSFSRDLHLLTRMTELNPVYLGILGPVKRREQLLNEIMEKHPTIDLSFVERLNAPAGLNLGAETPQEIALSVLAEIMTVRTNENAEPLKNITGHIHERKHMHESGEAAGPKPSNG